MNNLNIVLRSVDNAKAQIFTSWYNGCISSRNKCNFKLGSGELFPTIKPMSSTSKTVLKIHTIDNIRRIIFTTIYLKEFVFGRRRRVAVLGS
jgi:hypothetical protein